MFCTLSFVKIWIFNTNKIIKHDQNAYAMHFPFQLYLLTTWHTTDSNKTATENKNYIYLQNLKSLSCKVVNYLELQLIFIVMFENTYIEL